MFRSILCVRKVIILLLHSIKEVCTSLLLREATEVTRFLSLFSRLSPSETSTFMLIFAPHALTHIHSRGRFVQFSLVLITESFPRTVKSTELSTMGPGYAKYSTNLRNKRVYVPNSHRLLFQSYPHRRMPRNKAHPRPSLLSIQIPS